MIDDKIKTDDLNELANLWLDAKEREGTATSDRRKIEDRIKSLAGIAENLDGTETVAPEMFTIKIVGRIDRIARGQGRDEVVIALEGGGQWVGFADHPFAARRGQWACATMPAAALVVGLTH